MAHLGLIRQIEQVLIHLRSGQGRQRQGRHKFCRRQRHHRTHRCAAFLKPAHKIKGFVGSNSAADDQKDAFSREHVLSKSFGKNIGKPTGKLNRPEGRLNGRHFGLAQQQTRVGAHSLERLAQFAQSCGLDLAHALFGQAQFLAQCL